MRLVLGGDSSGPRPPSNDAKRVGPWSALRGACHKILENFSVQDVEKLSFAPTYLRKAPQGASEPKGVRGSGATAARAGGGAQGDVIIGKWINEGHTVTTEVAPSAKILNSDVYEWSTGGFFVLHTAYGRAGNLPGGGIEIIGCDAASGGYVSRFFDSQGNVSTHELSVEGDTWSWWGRARAVRRCSPTAAGRRPRTTRGWTRAESGCIRWRWC